MDEDNIFDDDDVLDFMIYEEFKKEDIQGKSQQGGSGCLPLLLLIFIPIGLYLI